MSSADANPMMQMMQMMSMSMMQQSMQMEQPAARSSGLKIFGRLADKSVQDGCPKAPVQDSPVQDGTEAPKAPVLPLEDRKPEGSDALPAPGELSVPWISFQHALQICRCALIHHACISQVYVTRNSHP